MKKFYMPNSLSAIVANVFTKADKKRFPIKTCLHFLLLLLLSQAVTAQNWLLTGNSGTNPPTDFLGTVDMQPLVFKTNNIEQMRIDQNGNVGIGTTSPIAKLDVEGGDARISGVTVGAGAGDNGLNTALGSIALYSNTTGSYNTACGEGTLTNNTTGWYNTANGAEALFSNTSGKDNTATAFWALHYNTSGSYNTASGTYALFFNTSGNYNTADGTDALISNTTGYSNTAIGYQSLNSNTTGFNNTSAGLYALYSNTTGYLNTANGEAALYSNTVGNNNTASGYAALNSNETGYANTASGGYTLYLNTKGKLNTADGYKAGFSLKGGSNNTFIGYSANCHASSINNATAIGNEAIVTGSNSVVIGNTSITSIGGFVNWSNISDGRVKKNIKQNVPGLAFINKLQPITYNLDLDAVDQIMNQSFVKDEVGEAIQPTQEELDARSAKGKIAYTGFIAQDVEKAAQSLNYNFSGIDKPDNSSKLYGLRYGDFVVPLVKAVQELSVSNDRKDSMIENLQSAVSSLQDANQKMQNEIDELEILMKQQNANSSRFQSSAIGGVDEAVLYQNAPNPFSHNTTIQFHIPASASDAMIIVTDLSGKILQQFSHLAGGNGTVTIAAGILASGTYQYSLILNGNVVDTKQMIIVK